MLKHKAKDDCNGRKTNSANLEYQNAIFYDCIVFVVLRVVCIGCFIASVFMRKSLITYHDSSGLFYDFQYFGNSRYFFGL